MADKCVLFTNKDSKYIVVGAKDNGLFLCMEIMNHCRKHTAEIECGDGLTRFVDVSKVYNANVEEVKENREEIVLVNGLEDLLEKRKVYLNKKNEQYDLGKLPKRKIDRQLEPEEYDAWAKSYRGRKAKEALTYAMQHPYRG